MFRFLVVKGAVLACAWALFRSADGSAPARGSEFAKDAPGWGAHTHRGWWNPDSPGRHPLTVLQDYDYIVVGSGPGGAPIAARLGLAGFRVLVIEAGHDAALTNYNVTVPYFNAKASEDERLSWDFYVNHYPDHARNALDNKFSYKLRNGSIYHGLSPPSDATPLGILYPRTAALGGCANHNAMIMMRPLDNDWNQIAVETNDSSWTASRMHTYLTKFESCQYRSPGSVGHGFAGWLSTNRAEPGIYLQDNKTYAMMRAAAAQVGLSVESTEDLLTTVARDLNDGRVQSGTEQGLFNPTLSMDTYKRSSPRDFLRSTQQLLEEHYRRPGVGKIDIRLNCLATRIIFAPGTKKAIGVEFLDGQHLYKADPKAEDLPGKPGVAFMRKEIILSGGTYNTPQLLMLSGVGDPQQLKRLMIPEVLALPGVGSNLQDRIENSVVADVSEPWTVFADCAPSDGTSDPCLAQWLAWRNNASLYATNGRPAHIPLRSSASTDSYNDLVITGRPGYFAGYFHGYSTAGAAHPNSWSWPVLKAYTTNRDGSVSLKSNDPREPPSIDFNYFGAGSGDWAADVNATVEGMQFARRIFAGYAAHTGSSPIEILPGQGYETAEQLAEWVKYNSWGHHACCTSPIGRKDDKMAVLDGKFRVRGASGLRVVDASVFPRIPGYYIQSSIYAISEKAADVVLGGEDE